MRQALILCITLALMTSLVKPVFAGEKAAARQSLKGVVEHVDEANHTVTIKKDGGDSVVIHVSKAVAVKDGQHVKVTLKNGTIDQADNISVVKQIKHKKV